MKNNYIERLIKFSCEKEIGQIWQKVFLWNCNKPSLLRAYNISTACIFYTSMKDFYLCTCHIKIVIISSLLTCFYYLKDVLIPFDVKLKCTICTSVMVEYLCLLIVARYGMKETNAQIEIKHGLKNCCKRYA